LWRLWWWCAGREDWHGFYEIKCGVGLRWNELAIPQLNQDKSYSPIRD